MTREEQLNKATYDYVNQGGTTAEWSDGWEDYSDAEYIEQAFKAGAEWEHKRLNEKACWWLRETAHFYVSDFTEELDDNGLLEDFKKAMEE